MVYNNNVWINMKT